MPLGLILGWLKQSFNNRPWSAPCLPRSEQWGSGKLVRVFLISQWGKQHSPWESWVQTLRRDVIQCAHTQEPPGGLTSSLYRLCSNGNLLKGFLLSICIDRALLLLLQHRHTWLFPAPSPASLPPVFFFSFILIEHNWFTMLC